ncbi:unnamed protein product [Coregonus sp. 'balchen']|nr:unnamed protein product [Coregonus sp. 'balchen']
MGDTWPAEAMTTWCMCGQEGSGQGSSSVHRFSEHQGAVKVSSLMFAPNYKELVSSHGYAHDNVVIWKYPSLTKVAELNGHKGRVLNITMSPDCSTIATSCFELDPVKKKAKEIKSTSNIIHQSIL